MKYLLAALLIALSGQAMSAEVWSVANQAGGEIVLVGKKCILNGREDPDYQAAFTTRLRPGYPSKVTNGCWVRFGQAVYVKFETGDDGVFPWSAFKRFN